MKTWWNLSGKRPGGRKLKKSRFKKKRRNYELLWKAFCDILAEPLRVGILREDILKSIFEVIPIEE